MRAVLPVLLLLAGAAAAQTGADPHRPTGEERRWLHRCLEELDPEQPRLAFERCAQRITGACLGLEEERGTPRLHQPEGRNSHPRSCAPIEAALWEEALNRWYREALAAMPAEAQDALRRGQRAWLGFRDAACAVEEALLPGFLGRDYGAGCRLALVAGRALEMRRLAALARDPALSR